MVLAAGCGGDEPRATAGGGTTSTASATPTPRATATPDPGEALADTQADAAAWSADRPVTRRTPVPVLMYHVIGDAKPGTAYPDLWVSLKDFYAHMHGLKDAGYEAVTLDQAYAAWHGGPRLPAKPVVVSFDDGYAGWYTRMLPVMRDLGWAGVLNLKVDAVGTELSTKQIKRFVSDGWEIDAHTITHPDLPSLDDASLKREVAGSREQLRERFGVPVNFLCYPAGRYDDRVIAAAKAAGYRGATTVEPGRATPGDPFRMARVRINRGDTAGAVLDRVRGA